MTIDGSAASGEPPETAAWRVWVDTGGTFTDGVAVDPAGRVRRAKVLSSSAVRARVAAVWGRRVEAVGLPEGLPDGFFDGWRLVALGSAAVEEEPARAAEAAASREGIEVTGSTADFGLELAAEPDLTEGDRIELRSAEEAPVVAARLLTGTPAGSPLPPIAMRLATTRGTNALLERRGAAVALVVTRGFGDLLEIGDQRRPDLFAVAVVKPEPLYEVVVEVDERLAADGTVLEPLYPAAVEAAGRELVARGIEAAAAVFLHAYANPAHERAAGEALARAGVRRLALSAELAPLIGLLPRAETAVVDAYLGDALTGYLDRVAGALGGGGPEPESSVHVMTSAGGLVRRGEFRPKDSLLSGPAGGVVGAARAGRASGLERLIAFDMGGTSTDVARFDGDFEYRFEHRVGDAHLLAPALAIETVAAGGGSVCGFDGAAFTVGPESAGADPGPACYGAGGPLTVTDVDLLLGRIDPERFGLPLDPGAAERALDRLLDAAGAAGRRAGREEALAGLLAIADERMAEAIRRISVRRGYAPAAYALVAFGGAGAQHACAVAGLLGVRTVLVPRDAGLLSALGLGAAVIERFAHRQVLAPLAECREAVEGLLAELGEEARLAVIAEGMTAEAVAVRRRIAELRFAGQESVIEVEVGGDLADEPGAAGEGGGGGGGGAERLADRIRDDFAERYSERYGYLPEGRVVELVALRVAASSAAGADGAAEPGVGRPAGGADPAPAARRAWFAGGWRDTPVHDREALAEGARLAGPALVFEAHSATVLPPAWTLTVDHARALVLERES